MSAVASFFGLLEQAGLAHKKLLDEAYEKGREAGRAEAMAEFKTRLAGLTDTLLGSGLDSADSDQAPDDGDCPPHESEVEDTKRATPGSVKPTIHKLVTERPGISTRELQRITGFKLNSIRGTLWTLQQEKLIERRADGVYPVAPHNEVEVGADVGDTEAQTNEAVGNASEEEAPTASVENVQSDVFN